jgi:hypothetical protein
MEPVFVFVLLSLSVFRLTRLVVFDTFPPVEWVRDRLAGEARKAWSPYWLSELLSCPWCASGWISLALTFGTWLFTPVPVPLLMWLASWAVGAWIAAQDWS